MTDYTIYRLFDYETGLYIDGEFSSVREFFDHHKKHTFPIACRHHGVDFFDPKHITLFGEPYYADNFPTRRQGIFHDRYAIKDAYGKTYPDPQKLYRLAYPPRPMFRGIWVWDYDWDDPKVFPSKSNINKLKPETWSWFYRGVRTANEIRQNNGHVNEYGQNMVRAKRRRFNLPSSWDDRPNSRWGTRKSWKHNSKRRHQWGEK